MDITNHKTNFLRSNSLDKNSSAPNNTIFVQKASGDKEPFAKEKLERSLHNAGASDAIIHNIVADIMDWIITGVTTKKIYSRAFTLLRREKTSAANRYKLKQAIMQLGPTGYPFESYIGQLFERQGYNIRVGVVVDGYSITHEMDVVATNNKNQNLVECKYHSQGKHVNIQVPLYVHSRVNDIIRKRKELPEYTDFSFSTWIITNTRFSDEAIKYGQCYNLHLLAWDYPTGKGLKDIIEELKLYPITILTHLTRKHKQTLLNQGVVTCKQLLTGDNLGNTFNLSEKKHVALLKELKDICG